MQNNVTQLNVLFLGSNDVFTKIEETTDFPVVTSNCCHNGDNFDSDNWWKKSSPGPSHQECSGNQQWFCEVHKVPLK